MALEEVISSGENSGLRLQNLSSMLGKGKSLIASAQLNTTASTMFNRLTLRNGIHLYFPSLHLYLDKFDEGIDGELTLKGIMGQQCARCTFNSVSYPNNRLLLQGDLDTFQGYEGSGFGTALFHLRELLQIKCLDLINARRYYSEVVAIVEDTAFRRTDNSGSATNWTSYIGEVLGYKHNEALMRDYALRNNYGPILMKKLI